MIVGDRLDSYVAKLKEREDNLSVYAEAIKDWSDLYFRHNFGLPKSFETSPVQRREASPANSDNSILWDDRGDIPFLLPEYDVSTPVLTDESVSEAPHRRSRARKRKRSSGSGRSLSGTVSNYALYSIPDSSDWEALDDGSDGDDDDEDDEDTPTKAPTSSPPSSKCRRVTPASSLQMGVRTRLSKDEKAHGFILIDSLLKEGKCWLFITDRYNEKFGGHRSVDSVKAVWDRLSLNPRSTEGAIMISSDIERDSREVSSNNTVIRSVPEFVSSSTAAPKKQFGDGNVATFRVTGKRHADDMHVGKEQGGQ